MASESIKIFEKIKQYLVGDVADIGCGDEPIVEGAFGIDGRFFPCVKFVVDGLYGLPDKIDKRFDTCFSSHCLEHLPDAYRSVNEWGQLVKQGGHFILYLPDGDYYPNQENPEHFHDTKYEPFLMWFKRAFCGEAKNYKGEQYAPPIFELIESGQDVIEEQHYSFYIVAKKI